MLYAVIKCKYHHFSHVAISVCLEEKTKLWPTFLQALLKTKHQNLQKEKWTSLICYVLRHFSVSSFGLVEAEILAPQILTVSR